MKREDTHLEPVMLVEWDRQCSPASSWGHVHLHGHVRLLDTTKSSSDVLCGSLDYLSGYIQWQAELSGLRIRCQGSNNDTPRRLYGFDVQWTGRDIELRECERAYKVLKRIHQGLDKLDNEWGYVGGSYPEYIIRVCKVLKIKHIAIRKTAKAEEQTGYKYSLHEVGKEARSRLDWLLAEWIKAGEPKEEAVPV